MQQTQPQTQQQHQKSRYALVPHRHIAASKDLRFADERYVTIGHMTVISREAGASELDELLLCDVENQRVKLLEFTREHSEQPQEQAQEQQQQQESQQLQSQSSTGSQKPQLRLRIASSVDCLGWPCAAIVLPNCSERNRIAVLETARHRIVQSHVNLVVSFYTLPTRPSGNFLQVPAAGSSRSVPSGSSGSSMEHSSFEDDTSSFSNTSVPVVPPSLGPGGLSENQTPLVLQEGDASWFGSMHVVPANSASQQSTVLTSAFGFDRLYILGESSAQPKFQVIRNQLRMPLDIFDFTYCASLGLFGVLLSDETVRIYSHTWALVQEVKLPKARKSVSRRSSDELTQADVANSYKILITPERKLLVAQLATNSILCFDVTTGEYHGVVAGDIVVVCWAATEQREIFIYDLLTKFVVSYVLVKQARRGALIEQKSQLSLAVNIGPNYNSQS